jgi:hypothetical protein
MGSNLHKQEYLCLNRLLLLRQDKLTVKLPLGNKQKFTNFAIANKAFKDSRKMDLGALAWVERSNKIMIERGEGGISFKGFRGISSTSSWQLKEAGEGCSNIFNLSFVREESPLILPQLAR